MDSTDSSTQALLRLPPEGVVRHQTAIPRCGSFTGFENISFSASSSSLSSSAIFKAHHHHHHHHHHYYYYYYYNFITFLDSTRNVDPSYLLDWTCTACCVVVKPFSHSGFSCYAHSVSIEHRRRLATLYRERVTLRQQTLSPVTTRTARQPPSVMVFKSSRFQVFSSLP